MPRTRAKAPTHDGVEPEITADDPALVIILQGLAQRLKLPASHVWMGSSRSWNPTARDIAEWADRDFRDKSGASIAKIDPITRPQQARHLCAELARAGGADWTRFHPSMTTDYVTGKIGGDIVGLQITRPRRRKPEGIFVGRRSILLGAGHPKSAKTSVTYNMLMEFMYVAPKARQEFLGACLNAAVAKQIEDDLSKIKNALLALKHNPAITVSIEATVTSDSGLTVASAAADAARRLARKILGRSATVERDFDVAALAAAP